MKITAFCLLIFCLHVHARVDSQTVTFSGKDVPLKDIFTEIRNQTGFMVVYNPDILKTAHTVTVQVRGESLDLFLKQIMKEQPLSYSIQNTTISIGKKPLSHSVIELLNESNPDNAPPVAGKVLDENGNPIVGVSVLIKGAKTGVKTDDEGRFSINASVNDILSFSSVGFENKEVKISSLNSFNVTLNKQVSSLNEVQVASTGYQKIPRERSAGSFDFIDNKLFSREVSTDIISRLDGIANSVLFDRRQGDLNNMLIRGLSTMYSGSSPLIIVDNFPYEGDISNINPNDVENITILKDASAASIWGVKAGNGVIVITTKKGQLNRPLRTEFTANIGFIQKPDLYYNRGFIKSDDYISVEQFLFSQGFYDDILTYAPYLPASPVVDLLNQERNGLITHDEANSKIDALRGNDIRKDLGKYFYRNSITQQYHAGISGGSDKATYLLSAGYDKNQLQIFGNNYDRITINTQSTFRPTKKLEITGNVVYTGNNHRGDNVIAQMHTGGQYGGTIFPYEQLADANGNPLSIVKDYSPEFTRSAVSNGFLDWQFYPLKELRSGLNTVKDKSYDIRINAGIGYTVLKGLSAEIKYQFENLMTDTKNLALQQSYAVRNTINEYSNVDPVTGTTFASRNIPLGDILITNNSSAIVHDGRAQINYNNSWGNHAITLLGGAEIRQTTNSNNNNSIYGYNHELGNSLPVDYVTKFQTYPAQDLITIPYNTSISSTLNRYTSLYFNGAYTLKEKYILNASARKDASNLFGVNANNRGVPLWSAGLAWVLSKEPSYHFSFLPEAKFRATYGYSGNVNPGISAKTTLQYSSRPSALTNLAYATLLNAPNPNLKWEVVKMLNLGFDFATKNNIVSGSVEYYHKKAIDLITQVPLDRTTGVFTVYYNSAALQGNGVDVQLTSKNIRGAFAWETSYMFNYYKDRVVKFIGFNSGSPTASDFVGASIVQSPKVGHILNPVYAYRWAGLDPATGDPQGYYNKEISKDYTAIANDSVSSLAYLGSAVPLAFGAIRNTFSYRHFSLSANITYRFGYYFQKSTVNYSGLFNSGDANADFSKRWQKPGDEKITTVPSMPYPSDELRDRFYANAEPNFLKGDHIRLQDIRLSYDLENAFHSKFKTIQIYLYGNNLGILWKANHAGLDPDYPSSFYPTPKSIAIGIKAGF